MIKGERYETKSFGAIEIVEYRGAFDVLIRFIDTGYQVVTNAGNIRKGCIKDKLKRTVYGVGFFGDGPHKSSEKRKPNPAYKAWQAMMQRCYDSAYHVHRPTYIGCSVCDEWHNFQRFADWFYENYPNDGVKYQLDKDSVKKGNKIYSPSTCAFMTLADNTTLAHARTYKLISPKGDIINILNMSDFCRDNNLCSSSMVKLFNGRLKTYKGWKAGS